MPVGSSGFASVVEQPHSSTAFLSQYHQPLYLIVLLKATVIPFAERAVTPRCESAKAR